MDRRALPQQTVALMMLRDELASKAQRWDHCYLLLGRTIEVKWQVLEIGKTRRWCDLTIARDIWRICVQYDILFKVI